MSSHISGCVERGLIRLSRFEQQLKWFAVVLGFASTVAIVQNWHPWPIYLGLPFCVIWIYCAWLHTEKQLKYINIIFSVLYVYGIAVHLGGS